jgi:dephospho-CoA kinase
MMVVVITGGIASGKSSVVQILAELGAAVIDADKVVHGLLERGRRVKERVAEAFGKGVLRGDKIDRKALGEIVFSSKEKRILLEKVLHPQVKRIIARKIRRLEKSGIPLVFVEVPLYFEVNWPSNPDEVWVIYASPDAQKARLKGTHISGRDIDNRLKAQLPWEIKLARATLVIDNSGPPDALKDQVLRAYGALLKKLDG